MNPTQIKSATGNTGAFAADNPDIRYRRDEAQRGAASTVPLTRSKSQLSAGLLNRALVRQFQDPSWSNAYVQRDLPEPLAEFASAAEAAFGTKVIGITATGPRFDQFNGINLGGRQFVNLNAPVSFVNVTGHEILHQLKKDRPDLYQWFQSEARGHYKNLPAYKARLDALLQPGEKPFTRAAAEEELLADFTGDALADPVFVEKLAKADPGRFRQLLNAVLKFLKTAMDRLTQKGLGSSAYFTDIETLRDHLAKVLVAYGQGGAAAVGKIEGPKFHQAWHGINAAMPDNTAPGPQGDAQSGANRGKAVIARTPWKDFPDVYIHADEVAVKHHPSYQAAKTGDGAAAARLVNNFLTNELIKGVQSLIGTSKPIVVSVHAIESGGINAIPEALADALSVRLGLPVDDRIVQTNIVGHTGADGFSRMARQALFDGEVEAGTDYLIVDDFVGQGGTLANLRGYIESKGGRVLGAAVLTGRPYSSKLKASAEQIQALREKHGQLEDWWRQQFGFGFDALTESEARYLQRTPDVDRIRDRITAAQQAATGAADQTAHQEIGNALRRNAGDDTRADSTPKFSRRQPDLNTSPAERARESSPLEDAGEADDPDAVAAAAERELAQVDAAVASGGGWKGALQRLNGKGEESFQKLSGKARRAVLSG